MLEIYWGCFLGGILLAVVTIVFGDLLGAFVDGVSDLLPEFLHPMLMISSITMFGAAGILFSKYSSIAALPIMLLSFIAAVVLSVLIYFFYVKPMANSENSAAYSIQELAGKIGEITIPVPAQGYGEVLMKLGAGRVHQIAASYDGDEIYTGARVVVVEVRENVLYVSKFDSDPFQST